jgi:mRNA-degrading endonuclease RelE of RelBE toxin-antitoxin system
LEAIVEVTGLHFPFRYLGDTFKPLHGDLDGLWRYRVGDWRLVIKPKVGAAEIELVTFAARGSVYD